MIDRCRASRPLRALAALLTIPLAACGQADVGAGSRTAEQTAPAAAPAGALPADIAIVSVPEDSTVFAQTVEWARTERADTLPIGELVAAIGRRFLGAPYIAGSLDPAGPERLIVNLRAFDCVTYVESMLAMARAIRAGAGPGDFRTFANELFQLRYRAADSPAYTQRLHYFSDWIASNAAHGRVENITRKLGGTRDGRPIEFMTTHVASYPQLADSANLEAMKARERILTATARYRIAEDSIAPAADGIHTGDVIAATSTVPGLDIAHTGIAVRVDGAVHLMHAPLAGGVVEISEVPLAERIQRIAGQDGIMVARPR